MVVEAVRTGRRPPEPGSDAYDRGFSESLWDLTQHCWRQRSHARPSAEAIVQALLAAL